VKPRFGSRGRHTTTFVSTLVDLKVAYKSARELSWPVIVEEHLTGSVYRATCVDGKLVGILAGDPPRITGDGVHTIKELIDTKNATRPERVGEVKYTEKLTAFLARQQYTLETVLPAGLRIDLSEKIGLSYGGCSREDTAVTHPKLQAELARAAKVVGDPLLGFDFIAPSITADPDTMKWGIIECNSVPFINLHHDPLEGTPVNAAAAVWDWIERDLHRVSLFSRL
jgi:cyanophycin synthetase